MCDWQQASLNGLWRPLVRCATLLLFVGCQPQGREAQYQHYLTRLGHTLAVDTPAISLPVLPGPPGAGQSHHDIPPGSLDTLDFLVLSGCAVQATIGKRNSSLGRLASDSQRLLLALEYLRLAPLCITHQRGQGAAALADTLERAWQLQRQQLPALIFNATLAGAEYRAFWHAPAHGENFSTTSSDQVIAPLQGINGLVRRWLSGDYRADNRAFEILLSEITAGEGGATLQALASQYAWLTGADTVLVKRMARGPLCSPGIRPAAADILPVVIRKYFIDEILSGAADLDRRYGKLLPPVAALEELLSRTLAPDYHSWRGERNALLVKLVAAPGRHAELLTTIQRPCIGT